MTNHLDDYEGRSGVDFEKLEITVDVQRYIDDAVTQLHNQVASQVETNLQLHLKVAFTDVLSQHSDCFDAGDVEEMFRDFLHRLAVNAGIAVSLIEERR